jgi:uncharacterized membrane protein
METEENPTPDPEHAAPETRKLPVRWMVAIAALSVIIPWLLYTPAGLTGKADAIGYAICHQIPARSFQINGRPISLCARCTGMYVGVFVGLVYQLVIARRRSEWPDKFKLAVFAILFLAFAVDGSNSAFALFFGKGLLYETTNLTRLITGTGMGLTMAGMVLPAFNQTLYQAYDPQTYFHTWRAFGGYLFAGAVSAALILTQANFILRTFSYIGVIGVVVILTMLYTMVGMTIFGKENSLSGWRSAVPWLLGGLTFAFLHLGAIDLVRFMLTGTWEGFHL